MDEMFVQFDDVTDFGEALKQQCLYVCVSNAWKILPVTARSPKITHLNTLNRAFLTVSVFGHLEFACTGGFTKT
jgi:hypothetical protein